MEINTSRSFGDSTVFAPPETYEGKVFNPELLAEQAAAAFGERYANNDCPGRGMDTRGMGLYLYPLKDVEPDKEADLKKWLEVIVAHDGTKLTVVETEALARAEVVATIKVDYANWDNLDSAAKDDLQKRIIALQIEKL